ncbi:MAG: hypothetical protein KDD51_13305 [Bdellovibrionales bacterium]|nr:hypothetical protein [Bdellovibrionales bacterium]
MKFHTKFSWGAIALLALHVSAIPAHSTDFNSRECQDFCAAVEGVEAFVAQAKRNRFFGELDTPAKEQEVATRYRQYLYVRTRYYELENKLRFLGTLQMLRTRFAGRIASPGNPSAAGRVSGQLLRQLVAGFGDAEMERFSEYAMEFLGTSTPTLDEFSTGVETGAVAMTLALIRKTFYKLAMKEQPVSRSWLQMEPREVKAIHDLTIAALFAEARPAGETAIEAAAESLASLRPRVAALLQKPSVPSAYKPELRDHLAYLTTYSLPPETAFVVLIGCLERDYR